MKFRPHPSGSGFDQGYWCRSCWRTTPTRCTRQGHVVTPCHYIEQPGLSERRLEMERLARTRANEARMLGEGAA